MAQVAEIDSARALTRYANKATQNNDFSAANIWYKKALALAKKAGSHELEDYCMNGLADILIRQGEATKARDILVRLDYSNPEDAPPRVQGRTLELLGLLDLQSDKIESALRHFIAGIRLLEPRVLDFRDSMELANLYTLWGESQRRIGKYDEAISMFRKSLKTRTAGELISTGALQERVFISLMYALKGETDTAYSMMVAILGSRDTVLLSQSIVGAIAYSVLAFLESNKGLRKEALEHEAQAVRMATTINPPDKHELAAFYCGITDRYCEVGDFAMALEYADRGVHLMGMKSGRRLNILASIYGARAGALLGLKRLPEALVSINRSLRLFAGVAGSNHPTVAWMLEVQARILVGLGRTAEALHSIQRAIVTRRRLSDSDVRYDIVRLLIQESEILISSGRYLRADSTLKVVRRLYAQSSSASRFQLANIEYGLASTSLHLRRPREALDHVDSVLMISGFTSGNPHQRGIRYPDLAINALSIRSEAEYALSLSAPDSLRLMSQAMESLRSAIEISEEERRAFSQEETRILHGNTRAQLYERAVGLALVLERASGDLQYRYEALGFCDRRKGWVLREEMQWRDRWKSASVSESSIMGIIALDRRIAAATIALELGTAEYRASGGRSTLDKESRLLQLEALRDSVMRALPPEVYLTRGDRHDWIRRIQSKVPKKTAILSYFVGDRHSYIFVVRRDTLIVLPLANSMVLQKDVDALNHAVRTIHVPEALQASTRLYRSLVGPVVPSLSGITSMVIVPDGFLTALPFEALARKSRAASDGRALPDLTQIPFLIREYETSYAQSVESCLDRPVPIDQARLPDSANFAGFAPGFEESRTLTPSSVMPTPSPIPEKRDEVLQYSEEEIRKVAQLFRIRGRSASSYVGAEASKEQFQREATRSAVLHVATHGVIDEQRPILSALLFSSATGTTSRDSASFFAGDASTMKLTSDLVVLSSCESGRGKLAGTEGMLTMSRSFFQAGAKNILYALWPVGDRQSARLMQAFYGEVLKGNTYASGLRGAKLRLLRDKATAFPSKWAGFVLMGQ